MRANQSHLSLNMLDLIVKYGFDFSNEFMAFNDCLTIDLKLCVSVIPIGIFNSWCDYYNY